ncbi:MAG: D-alanyl-D-alanine carboxypeptidase/D-alanyl-D-alanine-endopeptidase [Rhabdochlamydiaceae bacterium]
MKIQGANFAKFPIFEPTWVYKRKLMTKIARRVSSILIFLSLCSTLIAKEPKRSGKEQLVSLQTGIERIILNVDPNVHIGVEVVSLKNGQRIYQKSPHHLFVPASSLKMITGAAAIYQLGTDYRFETKLFTDGKVEQKTLNGNLYLQGSGDPEFAVRDLEELVFQLKLQGISRIEGDLYIDNSLFDGINQGPGWMWDDKGHDWSAPIDALILNHSCIDIWVKPAEKVGESPFVYQYPKSDFITIENRALTTKEEDHLSVARRSKEKQNIIDVTGKVPASQDARHFAVSVEDPHFYTAHVFQNILTKAGFQFQGKIEIQSTPEEATLLAHHLSRPLSLIVEEMMKTSDNLTANCLFKKIGENRYGAPGTWQKGSQAVREFLARTVGLDVEKMVIMDGCGQSRYNLISAHQFVEFLSWMHKQFSCYSEFISSLPISGTDGTLRDRMLKSNVKGKVRAKTGAMTGISSLSGYLTTKDGEVMAFSILQNGFTEKTTKYKTQIEDEICAFLVNFSKEE